MTRRAHLIRLLTDYRPRSEQESGYRNRMLDLAAAAHDPFARGEYKPGHFTASAFVADPTGRRVLVVHHRKLGIWVQPGGHIEPDDADPLSAAVREAVEETGVGALHAITDQLVHIDIHPFPATGEQPDHSHFDLRFGFVAGSDVLAPSREVIEARWLEPGALVDHGAHPDLVGPISRILDSGGDEAPILGDP